MDIHVNYWAVLLAGLSSMAIGALYYAESAFGKQWRQLSKVDTKRFAKESPKRLPWVFLASLLTAYVIAHVMYMSHAFFNYTWLSSGVTTALWLWVGISATTLFTHDVMELRPAKLTILSVGNRMISLLAMGLILGWLHP